ncbi:MAG: phosphoenolpyruvate carboxylase [Chloroflexota bacterium]
MEMLLSAHTWDMAQPANANDRLRADVRQLGELVGTVLREQGGTELYSAVEHVRQATIDLRASGGSDRELFALAEGLPTRRLLQVVRAFSVYFHVINLAEQRHRIRTLRQRAAEADDPVHESVGAAIRELREGGLSDEQVRDAVAALEIHPVLTAHPSEARRRSLLDHLEAGARAIDSLDARATDRSSTALDAVEALLARITLIWQTAEARVVRPSVLDEVQSVLYVLAGTIYDVLPRVHRAVDAALNIPVHDDARVKFGSWVGGDRDGNPNVTAEVTRAAARLNRGAVLRRYIDDVRALRRDLSISRRLVGCSPELMSSIETDRADLNVEPVPQWQDEPYRRKLGLIGERLRRTVDGTPGSYLIADDLLADLELVSASLQSHGGARVADGPLRDLQRRVSAFGFWLAELEVRQHAGRHAAATAELLGIAGQRAYAGLPEAERVETLEKHLSGPPLSLPADALSADTREVLNTFRAIADIQRLNGPQGAQTYVISMTHAASDVLAVLFLAREAGLASGALDIVPLFETIAELQACGQILRDLLESSTYRRLLAERGNRQQVMVGYSDSNKDGGYLAATWATHRAQQYLTEATRAAGIELVVFHGRGGAVGRGGGPMGRAILARPSEAASPTFKITEQGEVIFARYGSLPIATRHFEQVLHALSLSCARATTEGAPDPEWVTLMQTLAETSKGAYERLVKDDPSFMAFFHASTPFPELATLNLASRPVSRAGRGSLPALADLRAIPWVFSWTQARVNLPGWFGVGSALGPEVEDPDRLHRLQLMYAQWPFFASALDNAQLSLGTADLPTARRYAQLAPPDVQSVFVAIEAEFERTVRAVLLISQQRELLERSPVLARSIRLRNPYVDALHVAQLTLLRRARSLPANTPAAERESLLDAIHHSINGIAAGLQTTG